MPGPSPRTLRVEQGRLVGTHHGADLEQFLRNHYLADELVAPVMQMLQAQATASPLFRRNAASVTAAPASSRARH